MISAFSDNTIRVGSFMFRRLAANQGGLLNGDDPTQVNTSDPLRLWVIQLGIILLTSQLLAIPLGKLRQPKVLSEIIGGIILGPTLMGRIPGFTNHIFPTTSKPFLTLVADIGLILYLFLMGLEIDAKTVRRNIRTSMTIAAGAMILPFGLGSAISVLLYRHFIEPEATGVSFPHFLLFIGVALSITAFPVLCRILTSLKLLDTTVGVIVLSAGVTNDVVGWILLALAVALVNASSGLTALWTLLVCVAFILFLLWPARWAMGWLARKTGSIENGPTTLMMTITILVVFASAFFTDIIGVNAIFGGFLAGLIVPRDGGLAIALTEKLEDIVTLIFLPLYFTLSGLSTNLGLLNNGITWGFTIMIMVFDYFGKFSGATTSARICGFKWREASAIGQLMSCKGLTELIVLNVGLNAGILNTKVFSMFVFEAVVLTLCTTPMVLWIYPPHLRKREGAGPDNSGIEESTSGSAEKKERDESESKKRFTFVLDKLEHVPALMSLTRLLQQTPSSFSPASTPSEDYVSISALRLIELSSRTSDVMRSSAAPELVLTDPLLNVYSTFGEIHDIPVTACLEVVPEEDLAKSVADHAKENSSDLVVISRSAALPRAEEHSSLNPFEALFRNSETTASSMSSTSTHFIRRIFSQSPTDVALYLDHRSVNPNTGGFNTSKQHIIFPFFGGPDDRLALTFVVQLCKNSNVTAQVVRLTSTDVHEDDEADVKKLERAHVSDMGRQGEALADSLNLTTGYQDTVYPNTTTQTRLASDIADNLLWGRFSSSVPSSRVVFTTQATSKPLHAVLSLVSSNQNGIRTLVVVGRTRRVGVRNHERELLEIVARQGTVDGHGVEDVRKIIGDVGAAIVAAGSKASVLVMHAHSVS